MTTSSPPTREVDVLIIGGGPVGLITAYQLASYGSISLAIIEKHPKSTQDTYGRAITLYPRSSELLDALGLADDLAQEAFACRATVSYDSAGKEVAGRGWSFMESMGGRTWTNWDFALVLRQRFQEAIFRRRLEEKGVRLESGVSLVGVVIDESVRVGGCRVTATLRDGNGNGKEEVIRCKYLVGADGGRSFVRREMGIEFVGETTEDKWVRVDGIVETDMPKRRTYCAVESPTHGNVLWAALDRGATRIGFAFTAERQKAYPVFGEAAAVAEAIESVKPFKLSFKQVDWWTIYAVGQRVAKTFFTKNCVFLAGDACHTHSSGAAQGMNTGIHDACNLAWKLALVLKGKASPELLETYESERKPNVEKLINYDKDISRLMTMQLPLGWEGDPNADPNEILGQVMGEAAGFSSGLSIGFDQNKLNVDGSLDNGLVGKRAPDALLTKPGTWEATRLHTQTPNNAQFHVVVFGGGSEASFEAYREFAGGIEASKVLKSEKLPVSWLTIPARTCPSAFELLGCMPLGKVFYDEKGVAHERYGVDVSAGAVVVLRPDGWVGTAFNLEQEAVTGLEAYFQSILLVD